MIKTLMENNQCYTMQEIVDILKISRSSVENHLHQLGYVDHFDVWVPHCAQLLSHVQLFGTPWTVSCQAPLSMEFSRQEYWSVGCHFNNCLVLCRQRLPRPGMNVSTTRGGGGSFYSLMYPKCPPQCLAPSRCSVNPSG